LAVKDLFRCSHHSVPGPTGVAIIPTQMLSSM